MKKRIISLITLIALILSLSSCSVLEGVIGGLIPETEGSGETEAPGDGGETPDDGGATPDDGGETPDDGGETPDDGGETPDDGGETPDDGGETPDEPVHNATPTIYLAGDSTVKTYGDAQYIGGWGQFLALFLNDSVKVVNAAQGGRSSRSFINEGRLYNIDDASYCYRFNENGGQSIEDCIKEGDYLFIQFGHNDDSSKAVAAYSSMYNRMVPLGEPDENGIYPVTPAEKISTSVLPSEYTDLASDSEEAAALAEIAKYGSEYYAYGSGTYKWYLKQYIDFAREVGAIPVLVTPVARVKFSGGEIIGGAGLHGENFAYVQAVRQLAEEEDCLLIDLFAESKELLETATPTYANFLMSLKPNELTGAWPAGYDNAYGNADAGYTGIEATHYNKYGAYLQAAKVAEAILADAEGYSFSDHILTTPKSYVDPSNLIGKNTVAVIEALFETVSVTNPDRTYASPDEVTALIAELASVEVTQENYLEIGLKCEEIRAEYIKLNVDDRPAVTNLADLEAVEAAVEALVVANRPAPTKVVIFNADELSLSEYTSTVVEGDFTLVATSEKAMTLKSSPVTFTHSGVAYENTNGLYVGGSAKFGTSRYVSFTVDGPCTVTIATRSSGSDTRTLLMVDSSGANVGSFEAPGSVMVSSVNIDEAGTYSVGSSNKGIYIYMIIIEYFE